MIVLTFSLRNSLLNIGVLVLIPHDLSGIFLELVRRTWVSSIRVNAELVVFLHRSMSYNRLFVLITIGINYSADFKVTFVRHISHHVWV